MSEREVGQNSNVSENAVGAEAVESANQVLCKLDPHGIDFLQVTDGSSDIQDICPLSPLQEGMLFHSLLNEGLDTYVLSALFQLPDQSRARALIGALQKVIDRYDALRTAVLWTKVSRPIQVIYRQAKLHAEELVLDSERDPLLQLKERMVPGRQQIDLRQAPLMRLQIAADAQAGRWYGLLQVHHLICDHQSLQTLIAEVLAHLEGREQELSTPASYRSFSAQLLEHLQKGGGKEFFSNKLRDIDEPTAPFGLLDVHHRSRQLEEYRHHLAPAVAQRIRTQARRLGVGPARFFHAAWALAVAHTTGKDNVVFGTVLRAARETKPTGAMLGLAVNTLPLRIDLRGVTAEELVLNTHRELVDLLQYQHTPLTVARQCSGMSGAPLFTAILNYRHNASDPQAVVVSPTGTRVIGRGEAWTNYPITLIVDEIGRDFTITAQTDACVDPERIAGQLSTAVQSLVETVERAPQTHALSLSILSQEERRQVVDVFNRTQTAYPQGKLVHGLFEEQVERTPTAVAMAFEGKTLTYTELNCKANQLARLLRVKGVGPDQLVGICVERSLEMVIGLLGILKAGGAYVPIDPTYPSERLAYMLEDSAPRVLLTQRHLRKLLPHRTPEIVDLDGEWRPMCEYSSENLQPQALGLCPDHLAYVIYTSGSTGRPKGAMNEHRAVVNRLQWMQDKYGLSAADRVLQKTPFSFDVSVWEFFWTLMSGACLIIARPQGHQDPDYLRDLIEAEQVTTLHFVPSMLKMFLDRLRSGLCANVRHVVCSGEELPAGLQKLFFERLPHARLSNLYGPTEAAVDVTYWDCQPEDEGSRVPIGRPIANARMYVLDRRLQPVPIGVAGEIYIGGVGVGRGYHNKPELTAERFITDPYSADPHARLYRTGDIGQWRKDGALEYLGRNDFQVKIRGFRIELGEIESELRKLEQVKEAIVTSWESVPGERRLVAYVVPQDPLLAPNAAAMRDCLKRSLPEHMIPSAFVAIERVPLTPSGKLDRRALRAPELDAYATQPYQPPQDSLEETLANIWRSLLAVQRVGRRDNFFELGGHSLLVMQMMEQLRRVGLSAELRQVFESRSLADLASALRRDIVETCEVPPSQIPAGCTEITPQMLPLVNLEPQGIKQIVSHVPGGAANIRDIYPLAPLQEGMLFHHLFDEHRGDTYILQILLSVSSQEQLYRLREALQSVIDRHDVLRTAVMWEGLPRPLQVVYRQATLTMKEISWACAQDEAEQLEEWIRPERHRMDIRRAPLVRMQVAQRANGEWYALLQFHHIVIDHVTLEIVTSEIVSHVEGRQNELEDSIPYRRHVAHALRYAQSSEPEAFFRSKLGDVTEPTAPFDLLDVHGDGSRIDEACRTLDNDLSRRVSAVARRFNVSPAILFHAAWALVVARTSGRDDVVFGSLLLGRLQGTLDVQSILGVFINTLPLRLKLGGATAKDLVEQTQRELAALLNHEQSPLAVAQRCSGMAGRTPLFTALLNYRHSVASIESQWSRATGIRMKALQERTNYPIALTVDELSDAFVLSAQTDRRVDPQQLIGYVHTALESLLCALEKDPQTAALALPVLPPDEQRRLIRDFNATRTTFPQDKLLHQLIEEQVERTPNAVAAMCGAERVTYRQLNCRANQLARYLVLQGASQDRFVGLCVERSLDMLVAMLGILKAGSAYLPLDPNYPQQRLEYILKDAKPIAVLSQERLKERLPSSVPVILLDVQGNDIAGLPAMNLDPQEVACRADNLAYVIYTSGSTGRPKGVAVEHRNAVNLVYWAQSAMPRDAYTETAHSTSLNFDLSVYECFAPLSIGAAVRIVRNALALAREGAGVTLINTVPSALEALLDSGHVPASTRVINLAGEVLKRGLVDRIFSASTVETVCNLYGPSETTTYSTWLAVPKESCGAVTIGRPIANTQIYILDAHRQLSPLGVAGEIYIGGAGVARGYLNRPELTAERFLPDPFDTDQSARMYKTGDLGRWNIDGTIQYLGRNDDQVKIRGYRIELGEIEAHLNAHAKVKEAAVVAREDVDGEKRLVAYVTRRDGVDLSATELREYLGAALPDYMLPGAFVFLERMPLTPNGKLDRRSLPAPEPGAYSAHSYETPQGELEETVAAIWQSLLPVERVGRQDDFFEIGGHSLSAMRVAARLRSLLSIDVPIRLLFEFPTLKELSSRLDDIRRARVLEKIFDSGLEAQDLLETISSIPEHTARALISETGMEGRP